MGVVQGTAANEIRLIGGGAKSKQWRQILADMMGLPVVVPIDTEAGALGAALQAQWCSQQINNNDESLLSICQRGVKLDDRSRCLPIANNVEKYQTVYKKYQEFKHHIYGV